MFAVTEFVVTVKVALVFPLDTTTVAGICATPALLVESVTVAPPAGAWPLRVTVPVAPEPPTTVDGFTVTDVKTRVGVPLPYTAW